MTYPTPKEALKKAFENLEYARQSLYMATDASPEGMARFDELNAMMMKVGEVQQAINLMHNKL